MKKGISNWSDLMMSGITFAFLQMFLELDYPGHDIKRPISKNTAHFSGLEQGWHPVSVLWNIVSAIFSDSENAGKTAGPKVECVPLEGVSLIQNTRPIKCPEMFYT